MAFSELEEARLRLPLLEWRERRRPPPHIRPQLDISFRISGQSVEILEVRPAWRGKPGEIREHAVAKATYVKGTRSWRVYWMRADLKWHRYEPLPTTRTIEQFLAAVDEDPYGCFFG
jgi:hypothetical protein